MNYVFPLLAVILWAGNTLVSKLAAGAISPEEIAFLRWLAAVLLLLPIAAGPLLRHRKTVAAHWWKLAILGVLGVVYQECAYTAAGYTSAINMGVIQALVPLITIVLASVAFQTVSSKATLAGAVVSLAGVLIVISGGNIEGLVSHGLNRGDAMMLLAVLSMALYNILLKRWPLDIPLIVSMFIQAGAAALVLAPIYYAVSEKHPLTASTTCMILYAAIGASITAPMAWMAGSKRLGPARMSLFFNLVPIITAALAIVLLSEPFSYALLIGGALTLIGVAIAELLGRGKNKPQDGGKPANTMKVIEAGRKMVG